MQGTKKKSRLWSLKEIKKVAEIIESAMASGKSKMAAMDEAAAHFGVTRNAIHIRYGRYKKGESMTRVKRNTAKKPTKGVKRGPYGKRKKYTKRKIESIQKEAAGEVETFSQKQSMTKELRKMVIDLMNTSGHIKGVSVDLSSKSFTVIF